MTGLVAATRAALAGSAHAPRLHALDYRVWLGGAVLAGLAIAAALPYHPFMAAGAVGGALVFLALLLRPVLVIAAMLAVGAVDLAYFTGGQRRLLPGFGGLDMNGIRLIGVVAGFALLLLIDSRMLRETVRGTGRWYLLFLVYAGGTLAMSPAPVDGVRLLFKLAFPFLIFLAVRALVTSRGDLERLGTWALVAAGFFTVIVNPLLVLSGGYTLDYSGMIRVTGLGMHQNPFSMYLAAIMFLALARYIFRGQARYLLLALLAGGWIVLTMTRITLAGSLLGLGLMAAYGGVLRRSWAPMAATALIAAAVAVPLTPLVLERTFGFVPGIGELWMLVRDPASLAQSMIWAGRDQIWPVVYTAFLSSPWVGLGLGSTGPVLRSSFSSLYTDIPHNEYLRLAADTGLIGVGLLGIALLSWWVAAGREGLRSSSPLAREYALAAIAVVPAAAVIAVTDNVIDYYSQFTQYIAFFCAAALAAAALDAEPQEAAPREAELVTAGRGAGDGAAP